MKDKDLEFRHGGSANSHSSKNQRKAQSALGYYERAMKMEAKNKTKASLELYEKAFKVSLIVSWHRLRPKLTNI